MIFNAKPIQDTRSESQYSELVLGLSTPAPARTFEFRISGIFSGDSFLLIFDLLQAHKAKVVSHFGYKTGKSSTGFVHLFVIDASTMDCQPDDLLILLRKLKFIRRAEKAKMSGKTFSNFLFKVTLNDRRSVIFDANALSSLFHSLNGMARESDVSSIIRDEGRNLGLEVARNIQSSIKGPLDFQPISVIDWIKGYLQMSGWGLFSFGNDDGMCTIRIADPPISDYDDALIGTQTYLGGLVLGLIEGVTQIQMDTLKVYYNKENRILTLFTREVNAAEPRTIDDGEQGETTSTHDEIEPPLDKGRIPNMDFPESQNKTSPSIDLSDADSKQLALIRKILTASKKGTQKVHIMHAARISFSEANRLIEDLVNAKLLEVKELGEQGVTSYVTTKKGLQMLEEQVVGSTIN